MVDNESHKIWFEEGILYNEFKHEFNYAVAYEVEQKSLELLKQNSLSIVPLIIIIKDVDASNFKLHMSDYGKMVSHFELVKYVSGIWIVGASEGIKKSINLVNNIFFLNKIHMVDTVEEAQKGARQILANTGSILEK